MNQNLPCLNLSRQHQLIKDEIFAAMDLVYQNTAFSGGSFVDEFERNFSEFVGVSNCVAVSNGTAALHLAMLALDIGVGDEVILPANTFIATAWGVSYSGAKPVFVDCDDTWNIDITKVESAITKKTKAIIGVHLYGQPFDVDSISNICKKYGLYMIEDAAQAHGARYRDRIVGSLGDIGCFSFYPGKNLGACGEGGGVVTNDHSISEKIKALRNHGSTERYHHKVLGFNYRMGGFEAASLVVKLKYLNGWNSARERIAEKYRECIVNPLFTMQKTLNHIKSVYHLFVVTVEDRQKFANYLLSNGITPAYHYPIPCHLQGAYSTLGYRHGDLPISEYLASHCVSLPMFPEMFDEEVEHVINVVNGYVG